MEAEGPEALTPAQVTQLVQPDIVWICDFTVCADERMDAAAKRNSAIARMEKFLVVFFTITIFTPGGFLSSIALSVATCWRLTTHLLWNNPFSSSANKSRNAGLLSD